MEKNGESTWLSITEIYEKKNTNDDDDESNEDTGLDSGKCAASDYSNVTLH